MRSQLISMLLTSLIFLNLLVHPATAGSYCETNTDNLDTEFYTYNTQGDFISKKSYDFVGEYCLTNNFLASISEDSIILQTKQLRMVTYNNLNDGTLKELTEYKISNEYDQDNRQKLISENTIYDFTINGTYSKYDLETQKISYDFYDTYKVLDRANISISILKTYLDYQPALKLTMNYNNWFAFAYIETDYQENNHLIGINRSVILHTSNQKDISRTLFLENFTKFSPRDIKISPDGEKMVLYDLFAGFGVYDFVKNTTYTYNIEGTESGSTTETLRYLTINNDFLWVIYYINEDSDKSSHSWDIRKMDLNTGEIINIKSIQSEEIDDIVSFHVNGDVMFIISNGFREVLYLYRIGYIIFIILLILAFKKYKQRQRDKNIAADLADGKDYTNLFGKRKET